MKNRVAYKKNVYTKSGRYQIRVMADKDKARKESETNKDRIYKVRSDPKNGLRIVSFVKG